MGYGFVTFGRSVDLLIVLKRLEVGLDVDVIEWYCVRMK